MPATAGGISVVIESPPGQLVTSYQFEPGAIIRVAADMPNAFINLTHVDVLIRAKNGEFVDMHRSGQVSNFTGYIAFDFQLPDVIAKAQVIVSATYTFGGTDVVIIEIGIGTVPTPSPIPKPSPDLLEQLSTILKYVAIGGGVIALVWALQKSGVLSGKSKK